MKKNPRQSKIVFIVTITAFALVLFALVPVVGDWILAEFIYSSEYTDPTSSENDITPPTAQAKPVLISAPGALKASDFVADIQSTSAVTITFASEPDWTKIGIQEVMIRLTDADGNTATVSSSLTLDPEAPVISGTKNMEVYAGDTVTYKKGVSVTDNMDEQPTLDIDNSKVDLSKPGTYTVTYKATDAAGNVQLVEVKLTVKSKPANFVEPDVIYKRVDDILAKFITDDMTDREKAEAVYVWTRRAGHIGPGHFTYSGSTSRNDDYLQTAYEFLQTKKGDCFYFFALQKLMLERLNIPTIDVKKEKNTPDDSNHYWLLVSVDGGKNYYHFDNVWSWDLCLATDKKLASVSAAVDSKPFHRNESLYPPTPTENLPASTLPWENAAIANAKP